jgi:hypothetical protein
MASVPAAGATTTGAWSMPSGNGLYDPGTNSISVTNSTVAPVVQAKILGSSGSGYTLVHTGDTINMSATLDTTLAMGAEQFRFGMFNDVNGTIPGNVAGGTPWRGYIVTNSIENNPGAVFEKGTTTGGGTGSWWSLVSPNSGVQVGASSQATGSFTSATTGTSDPTPAGAYALSLSYTLLSSGGLQITWSMIQTGDTAEVLNPTTGLYQHDATSGVYSFTGSVVDPTPASLTFDQLGVFLYGGAMTNSTIELNDVDVSMVPEPGTGALTVLGLAMLGRRRRKRARC